MSYCLNPNCLKPENQDNNKFCISCGAKLLLADRYRAIKVIGQGGFGKTFLARDEFKPSQPKCVIKQFYPSTEGDLHKASQLFASEAIRLEQLGKHPQIPELYAYFSQDNRQYIVQEFIDGQNLAEELAQKGVFSEARIKSLLISLLPVLDFIHAGQVIHRDIKPENIICCRTDDKLVLVDFGAAKYASTTILGNTGTTIGSAEYVPPEQARGKATFASDLYSLGVTCLYLLTQVSPFDLFDIRNNTWQWRDYLVDNPVSEEFGKILEGMVCESLKERWHSAREILNVLEPSSTSIPPQLQSEPPKQIFRAGESFNWYCHCTISGHNDRVRGLAFNNNGQLLVSCSWDNTVKLWNAFTGEALWSSKIDYSSLVAVVFSPDGKKIACSSNDNKIILLESNNGQRLGIFKGHTGVFTGVNSLAFSPDGNLLASAGGDKTVKVWNIETGELIHNLIGHLKWVSSVAIAPEGNLLASASADKTIKIWQLRTGVELRTLKGHVGLFAGINEIAFSLDGKILASASDDYTVKLWNAISGKEIITYSGHTNFVRSVTLSPDGRLVASGSDDKTIKIWQINPSLETQTLTLAGHTALVGKVVFSPDGKTLATASDDKDIKIWRC
jgi:WD40 repeat protein